MGSLGCGCGWGCGLNPAGPGGEAPAAFPASSACTSPFHGSPLPAGGPAPRPRGRGTVRGPAANTSVIHPPPEGLSPFLGSSLTQTRKQSHVGAGRQLSARPGVSSCHQLGSHNPPPAELAVPREEMETLRLRVTKAWPGPSASACPPCCTLCGFSQSARPPWVAPHFKEAESTPPARGGLQDAPGWIPPAARRAGAGVRVLPALLIRLLCALRCRWLLWGGVRSRGSPAHPNPVPWGLRQAGRGRCSAVSQRAWCPLCTHFLR